MRDRRQTSILFSEHATVDGTNLFVHGEIGVRGDERVDFNVHSLGDDLLDEQGSPVENPQAGPIVGLATAA